MQNLEAPGNNKSCFILLGKLKGYPVIWLAPTGHGRIIENINYDEDYLSILVKRSDTLEFTWNPQEEV